MCSRGQADATASASPGATPTPTPTPDAPRPSGPVEFTDVTAQAGIRFKHNSGAFGKKYLPETMGSGAAFLDYDNDGWQDIFFVNGRNWTAAEVAAYKNSSYSNDEVKF